MKLKNVIAIAASIGIAYVLYKVLAWVLGVLFAVTFAMFKLIAIAVIALPLYFLIRNRLTSSR
jgi:predicted outer membrane lipoprotein